MKVECKKGKNEIINDLILSSHMKWIPIGDQAEKMNAKPVYDEIVINKLRWRMMMILTLHLCFVLDLDKEWKLNYTVTKG